MPRIRKTKSYNQPMFYGKIFASAPTTYLLLSFCAVFAGHTAAAEAQTSSFSIVNAVTSSLINQGSPNTTDQPSQALGSEPVTSDKITNKLGDRPQLFPLEIEILNPAARQTSSGETTKDQRTKNQPEKDAEGDSRVASARGSASSTANNGVNNAAKTTPSNNFGFSSSNNSVTSSTVASNSLSSSSNVAKIYAHTVDGKPAATVYVRGIPVMTFVEGETQPRAKDLVKDDLPKTTNAATNQSEKDSKEIKAPIAQDRLQASTNPIERAAAVASLINQMNREGADASKITPEWQSGDFVIKFGNRGTLRFDQSVRLPETTKEPSLDVLESANLIRRLVGGASPLTTVLNAPPTTNNAVGQVLQVASGIASWYGPGFAGNLSANGEIFDPEAMTAAHPNLPFGTLVRVVNMDNGQSVVVRINDRGPYAHGRVIDLSAGAARSINMIPTGVAPVKLEILGTASR